MKIAVTGKGGVGKSTITAMLSILAAKNGKKVLAVDADPDANLASALGISEEDQDNIITIAKQKSLIEERTGAKVKEYGQIFKLNPEVSDIADRFAYNHNGVDILVLGAIEGGGAGCACPESSLLKALVQNLILHRDETVVLDMEAGIEHLGRATVMGVDALIIVVEPGQRSISSLKRIKEMAKEIGLTSIYIVANKIKSKEEEEFVRNSVSGQDLLGVVPYSDVLQSNDRNGVSVDNELDSDMISVFENMYKRIEGQ